MEDYIAKIAPDKIINTAAYTAVDQAERCKEEAIAINALATKMMAQYCSQYGAQLLYYSTDYVFDGNKEAGYLETDICNPLNFYGESKLAGEQAIKDQKPGATRLKRVLNILSFEQVGFMVMVEILFERS